MIVNDRAAVALNGLANAPEEARHRGRVWAENTKQGCACAYLARALDIPFDGKTMTPELTRKIAAAANIPLKIVQMVPSLNDQYDHDHVGTGYMFTFKQISQVMYLAILAEPEPDHPAEGDNL